MDLIQIKHVLIDRRTTIQAIADRLNVSRTLVSLILKGERKGYRHRPKIARALGLSVEELFGERNGKRTALRRGSGWSPEARRRGRAA